ncbi:MAG: hypothetical protein PHO07_06185 [Pirellulales bacterium]|jgi:hypothetical protein|nr:hypothetical protein [Thermoguttaceae bacterium]MDD4786748.1 hypothetical protein [Pirellulales bacterium]MDI9445561.1 hypothetical protein [Planctomycetota bacterium]NLZ01659.1 hypothetical protein [Pirellulaceae bacterium]
MSPHVIRLRAPWQRAQHGEGQLWRRRFGRPTGLAAADRVTLVVEGLAAAAEVSLNGRRLGTAGPAAVLREFDVTGLLLARNELTLRTSAVIEPGGTGRPPCGVWLQIDAADRSAEG